MSSTTAEFDGLVREAWTTGMHGDAHLRMHPDTTEALKEACGPRPASTWREPGRLGDLTSLRIVADESVPVGMWRLIDNADGHTRRAGRVFPAEVPR